MHAGQAETLQHGTAVVFNDRIVECATEVLCLFVDLCLLGVSNSAMTVSLQEGLQCHDAWISLLDEIWEVAAEGVGQAASQVVQVGQHAHQHALVPEVA